jgi:hypothetical protein
LKADAGEFDIRPSKIQFFKKVLLPAHASYDVEKHYAASAKTRTNARIHNPSATLTKSKKKQTARDAADHSRKNHSLHSGGQTPRPHLRQGQWQQQQPQKRHDPSAASSQKSRPPSSSKVILENLPSCDDNATVSLSMYISLTAWMLTF